MSKLRLKQKPTLKDFLYYVNEMAVERGFEKHDIAKEFMMLTEEVGEFAKAARKSTEPKVVDDVKHQEIYAEAADVFIVLLRLCDMLNIDLERAFRDKEEKNKQRKWK